MKCADHARQSINGLRIERMLDRGDALRLQRFDRLGDLISKFDSADTLIATLDSGRLALNLDLEPNSADTCRLDRQSAGLARYAGVSLIAADHRIECTVTADFLIYHDIDQHITLGLEARRL